MNHNDTQRKQKFTSTQASAVTTYAATTAILSIPSAVQTTIHSLYT